MIAREAAWELLTEFTKSGSLRKHALAVEASMRAYAAQYQADPTTWGIAGMLHDFDYEVHPTPPHHPVKGAEILQARGVPPDVVYAILAHADYSGCPRRSLLDRALYACDELSGFVTACSGFENPNQSSQLFSLATGAGCGGAASAALPRTVAASKHSSRFAASEMSAHFTMSASASRASSACADPAASSSSAATRLNRMR